MKCIVPGCNNKLEDVVHCKTHRNQLRMLGKTEPVIKFLPNKFEIIDSIGHITLFNNGKISGVALIDAEDIERCSQHKWRFSDNYVVSIIGRLQNFILGVSTNYQSIVDHINRNTLDNRKSNLRLCNKSENGANSKHRINNTSGYKGVFLIKRINKWMAQIMFNKTSIYIGTYKSKKEAALAYNRKAKELFGEYAFQNIIQED